MIFLISNFFCPQKVKKASSKVAHKYSNCFAPIAAQTEEFMFQNVAYRPTVYRTGIMVQLQKVAI